MFHGIKNELYNLVRVWYQLWCPFGGSLATARYKFLGSNNHQLVKL